MLFYKCGPLKWYGVYVANEVEKGWTGGHRSR